MKVAIISQGGENPLGVQLPGRRKEDESIEKRKGSGGEVEREKGPIRGWERFIF